MLLVIVYVYSNIFIKLFLTRYCSLSYCWSIYSKTFFQRGSSSLKFSGKISEAFIIKNISILNMGGSVN